MKIRPKKPKDKLLEGKISFRCTKKAEERWRELKDDFEFSEAYREMTDELIRQCEAKKKMPRSI